MQMHVPQEPQLGDLGEPTRVIEVRPVISPVPTEAPPEEAPALEPERKLEEVPA